MHETASMTAPGVLLPMDFGLVLPGVDVLHVGCLFNPEQLVSSDHHFVHYKGAVVLIESDIPLCLDSFVVAPPYSMVTITSVPQQGLLPETPLSRATRGLCLFAEHLAGRLECCLLSVWACEAIPSCWRGTRVCSALPWVAVWVRLITSLVGVIFADSHGRVPITISVATQGLCHHPVIAAGSTPGWTGGEINGPRLR